MKLIVFLCPFLIIASTLFSSEELPTAVNLEASVSALVDGCVNAMTGDFLESANDIVVVGPEPLVFERFCSSSDYTANNFISGWRHNHDSWMIQYKIQDEDEEDKPYYMKALLVEKTGRAALYKGKYYEGRNFVRGKLELDENIGLTNCGSGSICSRTNPKNTRIVFDRDTEEINVNCPSGSKFYYTRQKPHNNYVLRSETKPNNHKLVYEHDSQGYVDSVSLMDQSGTVPFASMNFTEKIFGERTFVVSASDGQKVLYTIEPTHSVNTDKKNVWRFLLKSVLKDEDYLEQYEYIERKITHASMISLIKKPDRRFKAIEYYPPKDKKLEIKNVKDYRAYRVSSLKAPVGTDETPYTTHRFVYYATRFSSDKEDYQSARSGYTEVFNAKDQKTVYRFKDQRLTDMEKYLDNTLYSKERYFWGKSGTQDFCNLVARCLEDGAGNVVQGKVFEYDFMGNVIRERNYGNITGNSEPLVWLELYPFQNKTEHYDRHYSYSPESPNLLWMCLEDNGKAVHHAYYEGTDLLRYKLVTEGGSFRVRNFYAYDHYGVLTKTIVDDGSTTDVNNLEGVTQRKITYTFPRMQAPVGVPERTDEMYLDLKTGQEVLLKRIVRTFSPRGKPLSEDHYDSRGAYCYTLRWEYDQYGNVISETDALGRVIERKYDINRNLIEERQAGQTYKTVNIYDLSNRLIRSDEVHDTGKILSAFNRYDKVGNREVSIDPFGQETRYDYDALNRVTRTYFPAIPDQNGSLCFTSTFKEYDVFGNVIASHDQCGYVTRTRFNVHGKPLEITYPDSTKEYFEYNLDGTLKREIGRNGVITRYKRDVFDRITLKEIYSNQGELLSQESFRYNSFHLISTTDSEGLTTNYKYDAAGRLSEIEELGIVTSYNYDTLGRVFQIVEWYDDDHCKITTKNYDYLDRLIEEKVLDGDKLLKHSCSVYDPAGNVIERKDYNQAGLAQITRTRYNAHKQPIYMIDPEGAETHFEYNHAAYNPYGQNVLQTTVTDPLGNRLITTHNALGKIGSLEKMNVMGKLIAKKELFYSGIGDLQYTIETAISNNSPDRIIKTGWNIDCFHQVHDLYECEGSPVHKHTHFDYNHLGQKIALRKPDGERIHYKYDNKGRLKAQWSSDNTLSYVYEYDRNDNVIAITDLLEGTLTERIYDIEGHLIKEKLANDLAVEYTYDYFGRPIVVTLPDQSIIEYEFDACNLLNVQRNDYRCDYKTYDTVGRPKEIMLPYECGAMNVDYSISGRVVRIDAPSILERVSYDVMGNVVQVKLEEDLSEYSYDDLYQLKSESGIASHKYECDSIYNCISKDGIRREINGLNQLLKDGDDSYFYDGNGNLIYTERDGQVTEYQYDALDRLVSVTVDGETTQYSYDPFHRRVSKTATSGEKLRFIYLGENEIGACESSGKIIQLRVLGVGKGAEIGASVAFEINGTVSVPIHDHNGNVVGLLDENGDVQERYRYSAFGEEKNFDADGEEVGESLVGNPWRFSSKRTDDETGLVYFGRRYYDPKISRWITPDPKGFEAGSNLYAYVMNNPLTHIDLYGLIASQNESARTSFFPRMQQAFNWGMRALTTLAKLPGRSIQFFGFHLIPVPVVHDVLQTCGRFLAGDGFSHIPFHKEDSSQYFSVGDYPDNKKERYVYAPGILTSEDDARAEAKFLSEKYQTNILVCRGATHGLVADVLECVLQKLGVSVRCERILEEGIKQELSLLDSNGKLCIVAHSQGALTLDRVLSRMQQSDTMRMSVHAYGPARIIDKDRRHLSSAHNYVSVMDPIPFISDPVGCVRGFFTGYGNTEFVHSSSSNLNDHCFASDVYRTYQPLAFSNFTNI